MRRADPTARGPAGGSQAVQTRAEQLIQAWGKQAGGTADRYAEQMARTGSPTAAFHMEVAARVKTMLADDLERRIRHRELLRKG